MGILRFAALVLALAVLGCGGAPSEEASNSVVAEGLENGSFTAELNGFEIHYEVHGAGPVLMTLPNSWGLSLAGLRALYRPLENDLTMVYFDPRGMGGSGPIAQESDMGMEAVREDFDALRGHLGLDRVNAIGWSNGAMNLILLAAERPQILESAVFVHGAASFSPEDMQDFAKEHVDLMQGWAAMQQELSGDQLDVAVKTERMKAFWLDEYFPVAMANPEVTASVVRETFAEAEFSWLHADYSERESPTFDARDLLPTITARCLVLAGAHDMIPPYKVRELAEGVQEARYVLFADSGHFAQVEQPEAFRQAVLEFLGVIEGPPLLPVAMDDEQLEPDSVAGADYSE